MDLSGNNSSDDHVAELRTRSQVGVCLLVICFIGTSANLLVLCCAWKIIRTVKNSISGNFLYQYFVVSMTAADLLFVSVYVFGMFLQYTLKVSFNVFTCGFVYFVCHVSTVASSLNLLCLNIDKFIAVIRPLHHNSMITKSRVLATVIGCWIFSIIWASFFISTTMSLSQCGYVTVTFEYYCLFTVVFFILPTVFSAFLSVIIFWIACGSSTSLQPPSITCHVSVAKFKSIEWTGKGRTYHRVSKRATSILSSNELKSHRYRSAMNRFRTLIFVFATTAWSFLTCLPYRLMFLFYYNMSEDEQKWYAGWAYALFVIMVTNPMGNPFVTFLTQRRYRKVAAHWCGWLGGRGGMEEKSVTNTGFTVRYQTWSMAKNCTAIGADDGEVSAVLESNGLSRNDSPCRA